MRKPCFECNESERDNMAFGECFESPLCTSKDPDGCSHMDGGGHWETCSSGKNSTDYVEWLKKQPMISCPCCKGSGFVAKARSIVDEIRALEWVVWGSKPMCPLCCRPKHEGHESDCPLAAIMRRLK